MKTEQFREITGRSLLNELGDPHFLIHKFKWHTVEYNISRFQEKLKFCFEIFLFKCRKEHVFRYNRVCTHAVNSLIFFTSLIPVQLKLWRFYTDKISNVNTLLLCCIYQCHVVYINVMFVYIHVMFVYINVRLGGKRGVRSAECGVRSVENAECRKCGV